MSHDKYSAIIHCVQWIGFNIMTLIATVVWIKWLFLGLAILNLIAFIHHGVKVRKENINGDS